MHSYTQPAYSHPLAQVYVHTLSAFSLFTHTYMHTNMHFVILHILPVKSIDLIRLVVLSIFHYYIMQAIMHCSNTYRFNAKKIKIKTPKAHTRPVYIAAQVLYAGICMYVCIIHINDRSLSNRIQRNEDVAIHIWGNIYRTERQ